MAETPPSVGAGFQDCSIFAATGPPTDAPDGGDGGITTPPTNPPTGEPPLDAEDDTPISPQGSIPGPQSGAGSANPGQGSGGVTTGAGTGTPTGTDISGKTPGGYRRGGRPCGADVVSQDQAAIDRFSVAGRG